MNSPWQIRIYDNQRLCANFEVAGPIELGRQEMQEPLSSLFQLSANGQRIVVANKDEKVISRKHVQIHPLPEDQFRVTNLSKERTIGIQNQADLKPGESCTISQDALILVSKGRISVRVGAVASEITPVLNKLDEPTLAPGQSALAGPSPRLIFQDSGNLNLNVFFTWMRTAMDVLQSAANDDEFFQKAVRALVDLVHLDSGRVALRDGTNWVTRSLAHSRGQSSQTEQPMSSRVLKSILEEKHTVYEVPRAESTGIHSMVGVSAIVASPILDRDRQVIGVVYGQRNSDQSPATLGPITKLEAMLVELIAGGIAAGMARIVHEKTATHLRVQFEQFFTPELARQLSLHPDLLQGRDAEVTILFCDIRGFSRISANLGPAKTVEWINDVMTTLSTVIRAHDGVLVDYIGDELMAMWGAPEEQPHHAQQACQAALGMLDQLPLLNQKWHDTLQETFDFGIGINTGKARVGNTGSQQKFKYGPLGNTVNLASRVQGATKYFKTRILITGSVQAQLTAPLSTRRLCSVRVVNIPEPVVLHEMVPGQPADWPLAKTEYENALTEFENKNFRTSARILGNLRGQRHDDAPALLLLYRAVQCMVEEPVPFDSVWVLPGK